MSRTGVMTIMEDGQTLQMSQAEFDGIALYARREFGLKLQPSKLSLVSSRVGKRLKALGMREFGAYLAYLDGAQGGEEKTRLLSTLTTNVTKFFREDHHFAHLRERVIPDLVSRARAGARVRLWSAGCSSGQEPLSMAMMLLEAYPEIGTRDVKILATDIDPEIIERAVAGVYNADEMALVPERFRSQGLLVAAPDGRGFQVAPKVRSLITFGVLNLIQDFPVAGPFDVIFCRNVTIYFDEETQHALWARFHRVLGNEGYLYIGHSERLTGPMAGRFRSDGITVYRKCAA